MVSMMYCQGFELIEVDVEPVEVVSRCILSEFDFEPIKVDKQYQLLGGSLNLVYLFFPVEITRVRIYMLKKYIPYLIGTTIYHPHIPYQ